MRELLLFAIVLILVGCKTKEVIVTVPEYHTDTLLMHSTRLDSIYIHDSIHVREKGDTILIERWHTAYRDRVKTDTIYKSRVDSVGVPYPVVQEVERELTRWQKAKMNLGLVFLGIMGAGVVYGILKLKRKILP